MPPPAAAAGAAAPSAAAQPPRQNLQQIQPMQPRQQINPNQPLKQSSLAPTTLGTLTQSQMQSRECPAGAGARRAPSAGEPATIPLPGDTVEAQYEYAFDLLRQANYDEAEKALPAFLVKHPQIISPAMRNIGWVKPITCAAAIRMRR